MRFGTNSDFHLTYCTNIHPGESWQEVREQLEHHLPELKKRISPDRPFGVGLRLSNLAAEELLEGDRLTRFAGWLERQELYVFTLNGFPYGSFHRQRVKDLVYAPDWRTEERLEYTRRLVRILAELLPEGMDGGISTSPVTYKGWVSQSRLREEAFRRGTEHLALIAHDLALLHREEGMDLHIDIEPEPDCLLENTHDTVAFFTRHLFPAGSAFLSDRFGIPVAEAREILRNRIRLCYDTCHFAVEYETPVKAVRALRDAGIRIGKTQVSAALQVRLDRQDATRRQLGRELARFDEPTYLHQVIEQRSSGGLRHYRDLPEALPHIGDPEAEEWRIHFHVPLFADRFELMRSTRGEIGECLEILMNETGCRHYEIETYTWEVLPDELKRDLTSSIEMEFEWVLDTISANSV